MTFFGINEHNVLIFMLILSRMGGLFMFAPFFSNSQFPSNIKICFAIVVTFLFLPIVAQVNPGLSLEPIMITIYIFKEIFIGSLLGLVSALIFDIIQFAAAELDSMMGFDMTATINPFTETESSVMGQFFYIFSMFIFLMLNIHHHIILGLYHSFNTIPLGVMNINAPLINELNRLIQNIFLIGLEIAMPIYAVLMVINISLGILSRLVPQINIFFLSFEIKIWLGFFLIAFFLHSFFIVFKMVLSGIGPEMHFIINCIR